MRLGLFGGTFDPPHIGHLLAGVDAYEELELDRIVLIPAAAQPLKVGLVGTEPRHRLEMVRLLAEGDPRFAVDAIEMEREGLSFTVDTLGEYARREPSAERFLLVGSDVPAAFSQWREPERIVALAQVVVMRRRPEGDGAADGSAARWGFRALETRRVDVSSTEIRERVRAGRSIRGFVPDAIAEYIRSAGLYR